MIRYALSCRNGHGFEGWFASSDDYEAQRKKRRVACPMCDSTSVKKAIMAPAVSRPAEKRGAAPAEMRKALLGLRDFVEKNAEHVGPRFAEVARKIDAGEEKARPIYGDATKDEVEALHEDGIDAVSIPWAPRGDA